MSSAEDGRVTVALMIAPEEMITAYPAGLKIKITSCRVLSTVEQAAVPLSKVVEATSRFLPR
jgi:hypothetical protein